eukprot:s3530_g11.t1
MRSTAALLLFLWHYLHTYASANSRHRHSPPGLQSQVFLERDLPDIVDAVHREAAKQREDAWRFLKACEETLSWFEDLAADVLRKARRRTLRERALRAVERGVRVVGWLDGGKMRCIRRHQSAGCDPDLHPDHLCVDPFLDWEGKQPSADDVTGHGTGRTTSAAALRMDRRFLN